MSMTFGNIYDSIMELSARTRAGLLSVPGTYKRASDGTETNLFATIESQDTLSQMEEIGLDSKSFQVGCKIITVVLAGNPTDFNTVKPKIDDAVTLTTGGTTITRWVANTGKGRCWGYLDGNRVIWIFTHSKPPRSDE